MWLSILFRRFLELIIKEWAISTAEKYSNYLVNKVFISIFLYLKWHHDDIQPSAVKILFFPFICVSSRPVFICLFEIAGIGLAFHHQILAHLFQCIFSSNLELLFFREVEVIFHSLWISYTTTVIVWGLKDRRAWLKTFKDMARNQCQWL